MSDRAAQQGRLRQRLAMLGVNDPQPIQVAIPGQRIRKGLLDEQALDFKESQDLGRQFLFFQVRPGHVIEHVIEVAATQHVQEFASLFRVACYGTT